MFLLGGYLLDSNGNSWSVNKASVMSEKFENDAVAFRLCGAVNSRPLNSVPLYYLVPAANIWHDFPAVEGRQTIYINDAWQGIRRLTSGADPGWLPPTPAGVSVLDDEKHTHHIYDVNTGVFIQNTEDQ